MTLVSYMNSQFDLMQNLDFFIRMIVACLCGACIGIERTKRFKEAGIRTHIIVCCASALMMVVSKYGFADLTGIDGVDFNGTKGADASRVASQVVSGISFLGAGLIYKNGSSVKGLTTAAGIWATSGIGLAIGAGLYPLGLFVTLVIVIFQIVMHKFTFGADSYVNNQLKIKARDSEQFRKEFHERVALWNAQIMDTTITRHVEGYVTYDVTLRMSHGLTLEELDDFMACSDEIIDISGMRVG